MSMKVKIYPSDTPTIFDQDVFLGTSVSGQSNDLTIGKFLGWKDWSIKGFDTEGQPIEDSKGNLTPQYLELNGSGVDFEVIRDTVRLLGCETPRHDGERNNHESHFTGKNRSGFRLVRGDLFLNFVTNKVDFSDELERVINLLKKKELTFERRGTSDWFPCEEDEVDRSELILNHRSPDPEEKPPVDYFDGPSVRDDTSLSISLDGEIWDETNEVDRWRLIRVIEDLGRTTEEMINEDKVQEEDLLTYRDIQRSVVEDCLSQLTEPPQSESVEVVR